MKDSWRGQNNVENHLLPTTISVAQVLGEIRGLL